MKRKAEAQTLKRVSRDPPIGAANCFAGKSFVFTGELMSLDRNQAQDIVKRYGGYCFIHSSFLFSNSFCMQS